MLVKVYDVLKRAKGVILHQPYGGRGSDSDIDLC